MNTTLTRLARTLVILIASALPAGAAKVAIVDLSGQQFGNATPINRSSTPTTLDAQTRYYYRTEGSVHGTGNLAAFVPNGTSIVDLVEMLSPGGSSFLSGFYDNAPGTLPFTFLNQSYDHNFTAGPFSGNAKLTMLGDVQADGTVRFQVTNVSVTISGIPINDKFVLENGAKVIIGIPPQLDFTLDAVDVDEDAGTVQITVDRSVNPSGATSVQYATANGSALAGTHYTTTSGTLNFADNDTQETITIPISGNMALGGDKTFTVTLTSPTLGAELGTTAVVTVTILENDATGNTPSVQFDNAIENAAENSGAILIGLNRTGDTAGKLTVQFETLPGTALSTTHFQPVNRVISFAANQTTATVPVKIKNNSIEDGDRAFKVRLSNPSQGSIVGTPGEADVTILDDDFSVPAEFKGAFVGLIDSNPFAVATTGIASVTATATGNYTAKLRHGGKTFTVKGKFGPTGIAPRVPFSVVPELSLDLTIDITGDGKIHGDIRDASQAIIADFDAVRSPYSKTTPFPRPGKYNFALIPPALGGGETAATRPLGFSNGSIVVNAKGGALLMAQLADGLPIVIPGVLIPGVGGVDTLPCYLPLYKKRGLLHGPLTFPAAGPSDVTGALLWVKGPPIAGKTPDKTYPAGFSQTLTALGSLYTKPAAGVNALGTGDFDLTFTAGNIPGGILPVSTIIGANNVVTPDAPNANSVQLKINAAAGKFSGSFKPTGNPAAHGFSGVLLQKQAQAYGLFLGKPPVGTPIESGGVFYEVD